MPASIINHTTSDDCFIRDLKSCGMMDTYPNDPEKQQISLQVEKRFRNGFLEAATDAASLVVNPSDPYDDIYQQLGLSEALKQRNMIRSGIDNKKLRRLELAAFYEDRRGPLNYYHANVKKAVQHAIQMAYWRGQVHALSSIDQAHHHPKAANVFWGQWDYFHETLIKPWTEEVKTWAEDPIEPADNKPYDCPPDLVTMAFDRAANIRAIHA